jgi:hypothetical protein
MWNSLVERAPLSELFLGASVRAEQISEQVLEGLPEGDVAVRVAELREADAHGVSP